MKNSVIVSLLLLPVLLQFSCKDPDDPQTSIPCIPKNLQAGVIAFYPFIGGSINDFSGNNHHLGNTTTAIATVDRNGNPNCAFEFNNVGAQKDFLTTTNTAFLNGLGQFSISLWYEPLDTTRNGGKYEILVGRGQGNKCPNKSGEWSAGLFDCRRAVFGRDNSVWDKAVTNISNTGCQGEVIARTGTWHHLAATWDRSSGQMKLYRDGVLQDVAIGIANCGSKPVTVADVGDLFLGLDYTGRLDEVILYNKTLTAAEVTQLSQMGTCCK